MKLSILDTDKFIRVNKVKECKSARLKSIGPNMYDPEGVLSTEIFGSSPQERRSTFGYIDLKLPFIHPHVYQSVLKPIFGKVVHLISGDMSFSIVDNYIVPDENGWTGIVELYNHWHLIDWSKSESVNQRSIKLLTLSTRDQIFIKKLIITPAGYRDIIPATSSDHSDYIPEINTLYAKLIRFVSGLTSGMFAQYEYPLQSRVQDTVIEIYDEFKTLISKKYGLVKQHLMGKSISYGTRAVISAPTFNNETIQDSMVSLDTMALPIAQCCATFKPFISRWVENFFQKEIKDDPNLVRFHDIKTNKDVIGVVHEPELQFSEPVVDKLIQNFVRNPDSRFNIISIDIVIPTKNADLTIRKVGLILKGKQIFPNSNMIDLNRPLTVTDILYLACVDVCEKRHVMVSRYPVGTDKGIYFAKIKVQSTQNHIKIQFNGVDYPFYPDIKLDTASDLVGVEFIDTAVQSNSLLKGLDGDYDGDVLSIRGIWSDEANIEAERLMNSKMTALNITGGQTRTVSKEILNSYYELTKIPQNQKANVVNVTDHTKYLSMNPDDFTRSFIVEMIADTVDATAGNTVAKRIAKHQTWDTFNLPANYFYENQSSIKTTIGRFLFNKYVLQGSHIISVTQYIDIVLNAKGLNQIDQLVGSIYMDDLITREQFNTYIDRRDNLGYWLNGMLSHTISLRMAKPLKEVEVLKKQLLKQYAEEIANGNIDVMNDIENQLRNKAMEVLKDDPGMDLYDSGDLNFNNNYKNNLIIKGPVLNKITGQYDFIDRSFADGLNAKDMAAHANSIVAGAFPSAIMTRHSGYMGKKLLALLQMAESDEPGTDCGTKNLIPIQVTKNNVNELMYSYFSDGSKLELLTPANSSSYINKVLSFRSPMSCITPKFCSVCTGELMYKLGVKQIGLFAVQLSHSSLNLSLKSKHNTSVDLTYLNPDSIIENI